MNFNSDRLSDLLQELSRSLKQFKKNSQVTASFVLCCVERLLTIACTVQMIVAQTLRLGIWNWINQYPMEFVQLCQSGHRLRGSPDICFNILCNLADNNKRKSAYWPVMTMLLILCPDHFLKAVQPSEDSKKSDNNKLEFLHAMVKGFNNPKLHDACAICYVDICKASTYVQKTDFSPLRYQVPLRCVHTCARETLSPCRFFFYFLLLAACACARCPRLSAPSTRSSSMRRR